MKGDEGGAAIPMHRIYVIGHHQPDTDSICSVIAYAELLNRTEPGTYLPARCGDLKEEASYVLSRFGVNPPLFVESVEPAVSDLPFLDTRSVQQTVPTIDIAAQMDASDMRNMPVVDGQHRLVGLVSEYGLARAYMKRQKIVPLSLAPISLPVLARILDADVPVSAHTVLGGSVYTAIDALDVTLSRLTKKDVAIVGDNEPAQMAIISAGIAALIVADGAPVGERVIGAARAKGVSLLTTSLDAFGVGKMINLCLPGSMIMESDLPAVRMEDSLEYAKQVISTSKFRTAVVTREDGTFVGQISRTALMQDVHKSVILLDHNEAQQAVEGIEDAEILEIIDHHRLGTITTLKPVKFLNDPVGATSTIIARKYQEAGVLPDPKMAGILLAGILSDTLALKMSTTTRTDRDAVEFLADHAGLDPMVFGVEILEKGMNLAGLPLEEVLTRDTKRYTLFGIDLIIAQVMVPSFAYNRAQEEAIRETLDALRESHEVDLYILLFTAVLEEASEVYIAGEDALVSRLGFREQPRHMKEVMSRKKDFLPQFGSLLRSL